MDDAKIPAPFRIEHLCYLPFNLARTELIVRPCVAFLHVDHPPAPAGSASASGSATPSSSTITVEEGLIPRLDAKEVAAVFSAPLHNFLREADEPELHRPPLPPGNWYEGSWIHFNEQRWRMHYFYVPVNNQRVTKPKVRDGGLAALAEDATIDEEDGRYKVWGMTARIILDGATVAYGEQPEFEHNSHFGDETMIEKLEKVGRLGEKKRQGGGEGNNDAKKAGEGAKM